MIRTTEILTPTHSRTYQNRDKGTCGSIIGLLRYANPSIKNRYYDIASKFREKRLQPVESGKIRGVLGKICAIMWILRTLSFGMDQIKKAPERLMIPRALG
jgi:hypothetical protein